MILEINTANNEKIFLALRKGSQIIGELAIAARFKQSEKLLSGIVKIKNKYHVPWHEIKRIRVVNASGSFTSLRIGVATANALGYALGIAVDTMDKDGKTRPARKIKQGIYVAEAEYYKEPNITVKRARN